MDSSINPVTTVTDQPKMGTWRGSMLLLQASWATLKADRTLIVFPILAGIGLLLWLILTTGITIGGFWILHLYWPTWFDIDHPTSNPWTGGLAILAVFVLYLGSYSVTNYFMSALVSAALYRFRGNTPSIAYGLAQASAHRATLLKYSLLQSTLGTIFRLCEDRLPFLGGLAVWFVDIAWRIVSRFTIPVIVSSEPQLGPVQAVRTSSKIFLQVWGKDFVGQLSLGFIYSQLIVIWLVITILLTAGAMQISLMAVVITLSAAVLIALGLLALMSSLNGIFMAALYYYATTGESPDKFNRDILRATFKPRQSWFV